MNPAERYCADTLLAFAVTPTFDWTDAVTSRTGITKLSLSGFEVFDELTEIPIERLTFLFGPNSAGKSAIEDALTTLQSIWTPSNDVARQVVPTVDIMRHWRRSDASPQGLARRMRLNARFQDFTDLSEDFCITTGRRLKSPELYRAPPPLIKNFELKTTLTLNEQDHPLVQVKEIDVDDVFLLRLTGSGDFSLNFSHPALSYLEVTSDFRSAAQTAPHFIEWDNGVVTVKRPFEPDVLYLDEPNSRNNYYSVEFFDPSRLNFIDVGNAYRGPLSCEDEFQEFFIFINSLASIFSRYSTFHTVLVPASRRVPTKEDLTLLVSPESGTDSLSGFCFPAIGDARYSPLANSFAESTRANSQQIYDGATEPPLFANVNSILTNHLFLERGYRLEFKYIALIDSNNIVPSENEEGLSVNWINKQHLLVRIMLVDAQGREFSFQDVGSGLGYVLPVLVEVASTDKPMVMLQQPELHLHPALQAAMGDVLIDSTKKNGTILAETHSEHLLLRILKRIRQTTKAATPNSDLSLLPDEVSVLYFEPMPDGTTAVRRLRIDEDGEFIDRWPRGFFAERDGELFDE